MVTRSMAGGVVTIVVYGFLHPITSAIYIMVKTTIYVSFLIDIAILFNQIHSNLNKISEVKCNFINNNTTAISINKFYNFYKMSSATIVVAFFVYAIYLILQTSNRSLNIEISIAFNTIIVTIIQLLLNLDSQSSIGAVCYNTQIIHNVCVVIHVLCTFLLLFFEFMSII